MNTVADQVECFGNMCVAIPKSIQTPVLSDEELDSMYALMSEDMRIFRIMTPSEGDKRVIWNSRNIAEIADAKKMFLDLIKQGMIPFRVGLDGKQSSERMDTFDPSASEVIFLPMPAIVGG